MVPKYEHLTGAGTSSVDFHLNGSPEFYLEVVSIQASEGIRNSTRRHGGFSQELLSTSNLLSSDPSVQKQCEESDVIITQWRIGEKVFADGRPTKFPEPIEDRFHVLVIDLRGYLGGEPQIFADDVNAILHGNPHMGIPNGFGVASSHVGLLTKGTDR